MSYEFADRPSLESALTLWCTDPTSAASTYGDIGTWNVGFVSDFGNLFSVNNLYESLLSNGELYYSYAYNDDWVDPNVDESCAATFNEDIDDWETSHVTNMMVRACALSHPHTLVRYTLRKRGCDAMSAHRPRLAVRRHSTRR